MPRVLIVCFVVATVLEGCASVSSGIMAAGPPDTYVVTERDSPVNGGASTAHRDALAEARAFCRTRAGEPVALGEQEFGWPIEQDVLGATGVRLTFRCRVPGASVESGLGAIPPP
jgi:hypothetical protein